MVSGSYMQVTAGINFSLYRTLLTGFVSMTLTVFVVKRWSKYSVQLGYAVRIVEVADGESRIIEDGE
jgi:hypothetical protein